MMDKLSELRSAGFSDAEINDWVSRTSAKLTSAGFSQKEIFDYMGVPPQPDDAPIRKVFEDNMKKASVGADGQQKPLTFSEAVKAGLGMSVGVPGVFGLAGDGKMPEKQLAGNESWYNRIAYQAAQMVGDIPAMVAGAAAGAGAGIETGPGAVVTATAGAFAMPAALRATMVDAYTKGEFTSFPDFFERASGILLDTAKSWVTGAATGGAGVATGAALATATPAVKTLGQMGAELGTMVTVGSALEGQVPSWQDFADGGLMLLGAKGAVKAAAVGKSALADVYKKTGVHPAQVVADAKTDPTIIQDIAAGKFPKAYEDQVDPMFKPAAPEPSPVPEPSPIQEPSPAPEPGSLADAQKTILKKVNVGGETTKKPLTFEQIYTAAIDDLAPIKNAVTEMAGGKQILASENPYVLATLLRGTYGKAQQALEFATFDFYTLENNGKSLKAVLEPVKNDLDGMRSYAVASRALELKDRSLVSGVDLDAAAKVVKETKATFEPVMRELVEYQNRITNYLRASGVLSVDAYNAMLEANKSYVPFYRVLEEQTKNGMGSGLNTRNPIKRFKGSERDIIDPIESIIKNTYTYLALADKNAVATTFYELGLKSGYPEQFFVKQPPNIRPTTVAEGEIKGFLKSHGIEKIPDEALTVFRAVRQPLAPDEIGFFDAGKWTVLKLASPELAEAFKATDRQSAGMLMQFLSAPAKMLRAGSTLSPDFMPRNFIRDQVSAFINSETGYIPVYSALRGAAHIIGKDNVFQDWLKSGGANATMVSLDRRYIRNEISKLTENPETNFIDKSWNVVKSPIETLRVTSELIENATRLGEFRSANTGGKEGMLKAGFASRELTLDFSRAGTQTKAINMITAFFNSQVQGVDRTIRAIKDNPTGAMAKIGAAITLPSVMLWMANHDDPRWKEIPSWQRDLFWIVLTKDNIYRIPKPFELGVIFGSSVERMLDAFSGEMDKRDVGQFLAAVAGGLTPNLIPTFAAPILEQLTNYSFFKGRQLVPGFMQDSKTGVLPEYRYTEYTSQLTRALGHIVGTVPIIKDTSSASPLVIDNYIRSWTGGLGNYALQIADAGLRKAGVLPDPVMPEKTLADIPIIKAFVIRYPSAQAESIQDFRESYAKSSLVLNTLKMLAKTGDVDAYERVSKLNPTDLTRLSDIDKALSGHNQLIRSTYANPNIPPDQKRQIIDATYNNMIEMTRLGNKILKEVNSTLPQ